MGAALGRVRNVAENYLEKALLGRENHSMQKRTNGPARVRKMAWSSFR